jgi:hypothetical protein
MEVFKNKKEKRKDKKEKRDLKQIFKLGLVDFSGSNNFVKLSKKKDKKDKKNKKDKIHITTNDLKSENLETILITQVIEQAQQVPQSYKKSTTNPTILNEVIWNESEQNSEELENKFRQKFPTLPIQQVSLLDKTNNFIEGLKIDNKTFEYSNGQVEQVEQVEQVIHSIYCIKNETKYYLYPISIRMAPNKFIVDTEYNLTNDHKNITYKIDYETKLVVRTTEEFETIHFVIDQVKNSD